MENIIIVLLIIVVIVLSIILHMIIIKKESNKKLLISLFKTKYAFKVLDILSINGKAIISKLLYNIQSFKIDNHTITSNEYVIWTLNERYGFKVYNDNNRKKEIKLNEVDKDVLYILCKTIRKERNSIIKDVLIKELTNINE